MREKDQHDNEKRNGRKNKREKKKFDIKIQNVPISFFKKIYIQQEQ